MDEVSLLRKKIERERLARKQAENILESKALELFNANESLRSLNQNLEQQIDSRTKSLAESEERYRVLVEQAQDLIYNIDKDGYFLFVNKIGIEHFGFSDEFIIGKRFIEFIPEDDRVKVYEYYESFRHSNALSDYYEFRVQAKDGSIIWLGQNVSKIFSGEKDYFFTAVARDITKRKQTETALEKAQLSLQKSEIKYRSIIENMELGLLEVDTNGVILRVFDRFNKMLGYEEGELVGKSANETLLVEGFDKVLEREDSNRLEGKTGVYEVKLHKKDRSEIWVLISGAPFYNEKGQVVGSIGVHYDITDRKELQEQLEVAKLKAVKAQQAEKAFLANMSHEIRTPLNAIIGMSHLLLDTKLDAEQKDFLDVLASSTHILKSLISDILDISKIDAGSLDVQLKAFNLRKLTEQLISIFAIQNDNNQIEYRLIFDNEVPEFVLCDQQLLNQILLNLLSNAKKFTHTGTIQLSISIGRKNKLSSIVQFQVIDTGIGISEEDCNLIFNEFKQANSEIREKYGGTGLGLTISNQLVKLLGGRLNVKSSENKGSTFSFSLELEHSSAIEIEESRAQKSYHKNKEDYLILVVEDNAMNSKYIASLLNKWKLPFDICDNGELAYHKTLEKSYDLIFMDLQMPIMDGFEATQFIRSKSTLNSKTPIVALTASTFLSKKRLALKAGMTDFLSKPFTPDQLLKIIDFYLVRKSQVPNENNAYQFSKNLDHSYLTVAYGQDLDYAMDMFQTFMEIIEDEVLLIRDTINNQSVEEIKKVLHRIKPTFKMVGLSSFFDDIEIIEGKIATKEIFDLNHWISDFQQSLSEKLPLIEREIKLIQSWPNN